MKFDPYAFAKEHGLDAAPRAKRANRAKRADPISTFSTFSTPQPLQSEIAHPAEVTPFPTPEPPQPSRPAPSRPEPDAYPYGRSFDGKPLTWTGKVVSLAEWKRLSDWDKHGSTGKVWNGITRAWEPMDGGAA